MPTSDSATGSEPDPVEDPGRPARPVPELVIVGAAARDIDSADPRGWRLGGGVAYSSLLAAGLGVRIGVVVGVDALAYEADELRWLEETGADVRRVLLDRGGVFENIQSVSGRVQRSGGPSDPLEPSSLPQAWRSVSAFLLAPVADELDDHWANVPHPSAFVALAWQGLLRDLPPDGPVAHRAPRPRPLFARADLGGVSREDLRAGGGEMEELLPRAGQELVLTAGEGGALHMRRLERGFRVRRVPAVPARRIGDLVGAGDSFLTALVAARVRWPSGGSGSTGRALHLASVVASLTVEGRGLAGLPDSRAVAERLDELRRARTSGRPSGEANTGD